MTQDSDRLKQIAAESAVAEIESGMVVGLGSGSTAAFATKAVGKRVKEGLRIIGIATSKQTEELAGSLDIELSSLDKHPQIDITIDGADEVERSTLNVIKGYGGALLREKIVATATKRMIIIADESKLVEKLGASHAVPVEVVPFAWQTTEKRLEKLGCRPELRKNSDGSPYVTDGGHYILHCHFGLIDHPALLAEELDGVVGVVEHGLFIRMAAEFRRGLPSGADILYPEKSSRK